MKTTSKHIALFFTTIFATVVISSCTNFTPTEDNNLVMMRPGDIQFQDEVKARQKYIDLPTYRLNVIRYIKEFFCPKKTPPVEESNK